MARLRWNTYVTRYQQSVCFVSSVAGIEISAGALGKDGRKLPTAYGMLLEALNTVFDEDWTARKKGSIVQILVADAFDLARIQKIFRIGILPINPLPVPRCQDWQFIYDGDRYAKFAKSLGYS